MYMSKRFIVLIMTKIHPYYILQVIVPQLGQECAFECFSFRVGGSIQECLRKHSRGLILLRVELSKFEATR
ncbi:hypothetical protein Nepgr_029759 [Nepenthes gracilis]|uniref:Uncharacterized protein n=1 Tax=Nepenthes gracilis TaxID=150966 RepID=A0AAD3Y5V3_NEPGR|nr:hypothetical protein Nepgr_029759 [Nepenthes gracilis]